MEKDRNIVTAICKELEDASLIYTKTSGKRKRYYATEKILQSPANLESIFFGDDLRTCLVLLSKLSRFEFNLERLSRLQEHQIRYLRENLANGKMGLLPLNLQNFILNIGISMTYIFIRAMSSEFTREISLAQHVTHIGSIDRFIEEWIRNVILSMLLPFEFRLIISGHPSKKDFNKKPYYEIDEVTKSNALEVLRQLYPDILKRLDEVYGSLENELKKRQLEWKQIECDHKFSSKTSRGPRKQFLEYNNKLTSSVSKHEIKTEKGFREFYCNKCDLKITQNLDYEITSESLNTKLNKLASESILKNEQRQSKNYKYRKAQFKLLYAFKCKDNCHFWKKDSIPSQTLKFHSEFNEVYQCLLCKRVVNLEIIDSNTITNIRGSIETAIGSDKFTLQIADAILDQFYRNQTKYYSIDDFKIPEFLTFRNRRSIAEFENDRNKIINIFVDNKIIKKNSLGKYCFDNKVY